MSKCSLCHKEYPRESLTIHSKYTLKDGTEHYQYKCKDCNTKRVQAQRKQAKCATHTPIKRETYTPTYEVYEEVEV